MAFQLVITLLVGPVFARYDLSLYSSARGEGMGRAIVALADDEMALYHNPAALGGVKGFHFNIGTGDATMANDILTGYPIIQRTFSSQASLASLNVLMGKQYFGRGQGTVNFRTRKFGVGLIYDYQMAFYFRNQTLPESYFGFQETSGLQVAYGSSVLRKHANWDLRLGAALKSLYRVGGFISPSLAEFLNLDLANTQSLFRNRTYALGFDVGAQLVYTVFPGLTFQGGVAMSDVGDTTFSKKKSKQPSNLRTGLASKYKSGPLEVSFSYEYDRVFDPLDWYLKTHLGAEIKVPFLRLFAGLNQMVQTYGASFELLIFRLTYASYVVEMSDTYGQNAESRTMVQLQVAFSF
jgi:hypothetical protein